MTIGRHAGVAALCIVSLMACGGRVADLAQERRPVDVALSCDHLSGELAVNASKLDELVGERKTANDHNVGKIAGAVLAPTFILFLDLSDVEKREAEALVARNREVERLMTEKACSGSKTQVIAAEPEAGKPEIEGEVAQAGMVPTP